MKKAIILIICVLFGITALAQESHLSDIVSITLPQNAQKINTEKLRSINKNAKSPNINPESKGEFYEINNMLMKFNAGNAKTTPNQLEKLQEGLIEMFSLSGSLPSGYKSEIKNLKDYKVLIVFYNEKFDKSIYRSYSINNSHTKNLSVVIEFNTAEKSEATVLLENILNSVKFK